MKIQPTKIKYGYREKVYTVKVYFEKIVEITAYSKEHALESAKIKVDEESLRYWNLEAKIIKKTNA